MSCEVAASRPDENANDASKTVGTTEGSATAEQVDRTGLEGQLGDDRAEVYIEKEACDSVGDEDSLASSRARHAGVREQ